KFSAAALMAITAWPGSATGSGTSAITRSSGPQYCEQRMAFIDAPENRRKNANLVFRNLCRLAGIPEDGAAMVANLEFRILEVFTPDLKAGYNLFENALVVACANLAAPPLQGKDKRPLPMLKRSAGQQANSGDRRVPAGVRQSGTAVAAVAFQRRFSRLLQLQCDSGNRAILQSQ